MQQKQPLLFRNLIPNFLKEGHLISVLPLSNNIWFKNKKVNTQGQIMNVTLNPKYIIKPDENRAILMTKDIIRAKEHEQVETVIHPIHAMIMSFYNGDNFDKSTKKASDFLDISQKEILDFIGCLVDNKEPYAVEVDGVSIWFPVQTLVKSDYKNKTAPKPEDFAFASANLKMHRHKTVTDVTLMVTTNCFTNCIYCYADRTKIKNRLSLKRIKELIEEASKLNARSFDVIGGDVFAYKHWKELLECLYENEFNPYLSTKVPLDEKQIATLKEIGTKDIQISLDTLVPEKLVKTVVGGSNYTEKIKKTLELLDKFKIKTTIHTVVGSYNATIKDIHSIYKFINKLPSVAIWRMSPADYSLYKSNEEFINFRATRKKLEEIYNWTKSFNPGKLVIYSGGLIRLPTLPKNNEERKKIFFDDRVQCSANHSNMFILPDGKVTICEQLYWNKDFIIGDVTNHSLTEVWNSEKARGLYYVDKRKIEKDSECHDCNMFNECRHEMGGVCWRDIIKCYGEDKWHYPDPRCPKAPNVENDVYIK